MDKNEFTDGLKVVDGIIRSPGRFVGEPDFVPELWSLAMDGFVDEDNGNSFEFAIPHGDPLRKKYPSLQRHLGKRTWVRLWQDEQGFVYAR